jgi:carboxymethylenebutenolidase
LGKQFTLSASDSFKLGAYRADPSGAPKGGIVVIQEIFGVNQHIRKVCDDFAGLGYAAVAPALFDRTQKDFQSGYTPPEIEKARTFVAKPDWAAMLRDTEAAIKDLQASGPVGIVGFCMGGTIAFLSACRLPGLRAAVGYYGGGIINFADEKPKCPTMLHFGEKDASIPMTAVETIKQKRSGDCEIFVYPNGGHGFHCDERGSFDKGSRDTAWQRTTDFFAKHLKK